MRDYCSYFQYPITKPWPFKWFTPVAVVGGIVATVLLSLINYVSTGFELQTIYTDSPRDAIPQYGWAQQQLLSWKSNVRGTCEPQNIAVGSQIFTNHSGLTHTLSAVRNSSQASLSALRYIDEPLSDCQTTEIVVDLRRADSARASGGWWSWRDTVATANSICRIRASEDRRVKADANATFEFNITTTFKLQSGSLNFLLDASPENDNAKYWGGQLSAVYYMILTQRMSQLAPSSGVSYDFGRFFLRPLEQGSFADKSKFDFTFYWQQSNGTYRNTDGMIKDSANRNLKYLYGKEDFCLPDTATSPDGCLAYPVVADEVEAFGTAFYSLLMLDLGSTLPNALTDPNLVQDYLSGHHSSRLGNSSLLASSIINPPAGTQANYNNAWDKYPQYHNLGPNKPATIYSQYGCAIPVQKDGFSVFLNVLVADLVMLSGLFAILNYVTGLVLVRRGQNTMYCNGCEKQTAYNLVANENPSTAYKISGDRGTNWHKLTSTGGYTSQTSLLK